MNPMRVTPVQQDNGTWNLVTGTGHTIHKGCESRDAAMTWAHDHGYDPVDTGGGPIDQAGEGRF